MGLKNLHQLSTIGPYEQSRVRVKGIEFEENVMAFFPQRQSKV